MRACFVLLVITIVASLASADDKAIHAYDGQIVISPDPVPGNLAQLAAFLKANASKDHRYPLIKGPPWDINLVGVLAKDADPLTLVFSIDGKPLQSIDVKSKQRLVLAHTSATTAAGFAANKTYVVELKSKTVTLARAELELRN
jgi:hypothetical protein